MFGFGIGEIISGAIGIGGIAVGIWKAKQLKKLVTSVFDLVKEFRAVREEKSAGGTDITVAEFDALLDKLQAVALAAAPLLSKWIK